MKHLVAKKAPKFTAQAVLEDNSMEELSLSDYRGKYVVLFHYPLDFTFVCPSEIIAFDEKLDEFRKRNCEVIGVSVDSQFSHLAWKNTPRNQGDLGQVRFPIVADLNKSISKKYGVLLKDAGIALRGLFILDKDGVIHHATINNLPLGRNVDEVLRTLEALQFTEEHGDVCPANWNPGDAAMKPTAEGVAAYLGEHLS
jgi:peroxiredoxin (alkyl hydroperoxide reductase subunit C)